MKQTDLTYLDIFKQIAADIEAHPLLELIKVEYNSGISEEAISKYLSQAQNPAIEKVAMLYREANGLVISWKFSSDLDSKSFKRYQKEFDDYKISDSAREHEVGRIEFLPFEEVFVDPPHYFDTSDEGDFEVEFNGKVYPGNSLGKLMRPFDLFSEESCMSFIMEEGMQDLKVVLLSDYYIVWDNSRMTHLDDYISFLAITRGLIRSRGDVFSEYRGDLLDILKFKPSDKAKVEPKLFKMLK
jgi:hypothetical protein